MSERLADLRSVVSSGDFVGNLIAEAIGVLILGVLVTFALNALLRRREKQQWEPLKRRLNYRVWRLVTHVVTQGTCLIHLNQGPGEERRADGPRVIFINGVADDRGADYVLRGGDTIVIQEGTRNVYVWTVDADYRGAARQLLDNWPRWESHDGDTLVKWKDSIVGSLAQLSPLMDHYAILPNVEPEFYAMLVDLEELGIDVTPLRHPETVAGYCQEVFEKVEAIIAYMVAHSQWRAGQAA